MISLILSLKWTSLLTSFYVSTCTLYDSLDITMAITYILSTEDILCILHKWLTFSDVLYENLVHKTHSTYY